MSTYFSEPVDLSLVYYKTPQLQNGIGGYCITGSDGTNYHFAIPVYDYNERSESINISDNTKRNIITRTVPFANSWLLTAITGPDFIDRNENGLADDEDWGFWVKMNYAKYTDDFSWRIPLSGEITESDGEYKSYTQGQKQLYYLNSIETRSQVALFMKSQREDGKSSTGGTVPLKLDEICLLKKEHYKKILQSPYSITDYSDQIQSTCFSSQFNGSVRDFINKNCIRRAIFTYGYDLSPYTPNAGGLNNPNQGKLTLKTIGIKGRNDFLVAPEYKFDYYSSNRPYDKNKWDGWGMYNPYGSAGTTTHTTNDPDGSFGSSWSLSKITTPLGSEIIVNYERDIYASISGEKILDVAKDYARSNYTQNASDAFKTIYIAHNNYFAVGDKVRLNGIIDYTCPGGTLQWQPVTGDFIVNYVGTDFILLEENFIDSGCPSEDDLNIANHSGTISKIVTKSGGNLRVGSIVIRNELGQEKKQRFLYTNEDGTSSGVVSKEPRYIQNQQFPFYEYLQYPLTPVMYGRVSVLSGKLENDNDYYSKQLFEFETPHTSHLSFQKQDMGATAATNKYLYKIEDRSSRIGKLKSVRTEDKIGNTVSQTKIDYGENLNDAQNKYQGIFSEGTILLDHFIRRTETWVNHIRNTTRTTVFHYPYVVKKITNTKDGFVSTTESISWDFITGQVLEKIDKSNLGIYLKTITKPAYQEYPDMGLGPKAQNLNNKNMLSQIAAIYTYKVDAIGNTIGLVSAAAQTWRKDWSNYRHYDGINYTDYNEQISVDNPVWRKGAVYVWKGDYSRLLEDGTHSFSGSDEFNFSAGALNPLWQYTGENLRFDHYGMPLESKNMNNFYSATKMGYDDRTVIASAANAEFHEIAFSSAEDLYPDKPFFGGEVGLGSGMVKYLSKAPLATSTHTGEAVVSLSSGKSFIFKTSGLKADRKYRASVWANNLDGRIYYNIDGVSETVPAAQTISEAVNGWYRIDFILPTQAGDYALEIGVKSANETEVYFDDFRFQPVEAGMTCYVYPPSDFEFTENSPTFNSFTYVLKNENFYTKYEHNERGQLIKTYQESFKYGVKLVSESKENYRRFHVNQ